MQTEEGGEALLRGSMLRCTAAVYISFRVLRLHTKQRTTVHFECWQRITRTITCLIFVRSMMFFDPIVFCEHARKKLAEYKKKKFRGKIRPSVLLCFGIHSCLSDYKQKRKASTRRKIEGIACLQPMEVYMLVRVIKRVLSSPARIFPGKRLQHGAWGDSLSAVEYRQRSWEVRRAKKDIKHEVQERYLLNAEEIAQVRSEIGAGASEKLFVMFVSEVRQR